jgi:hypothetical protein
VTRPRKRLGDRVIGEIEPTGDALSLAGDGLTVIAHTAAAGQPGRGPAEAAASLERHGTFPASEPAGISPPGDEPG